MAWLCSRMGEGLSVVRDLLVEEVITASARSSEVRRSGARGFHVCGVDLALRWREEVRLWARMLGEVVGAPRIAALGCAMGYGVSHGGGGHEGGGRVAMAESCSRGS